MKRISFITLCLVVLALTAKAQVVPHYGESVEKETGKLRGKAWISSGGSFRQETPGADGKINDHNPNEDSEFFEECGGDSCLPRSNV